MSASIARHGRPGPLSRLRVEVALAALGGAALTLLLGGALGAGLGLAVALGVFGLGAATAAAGMRRSYPHGEAGLCNLITMMRLGLAASLTALLPVPPPLPAADMWLAFAIAVAALVLDGVDGWAARRAGLASAFGARFDMEVDSAFALILSLLAYQSGQAGPWVLALGLPRYLFVAAGAVWPRLTRELPDRLSRKAVCVLQIGVLVAFLVPVLPAALLNAAAAIAALALAWSFGRDIRLLMSQTE